MLQCIAACSQRTLPWVSGETQTRNTSFLMVIFNLVWSLKQKTDQVHGEDHVQNMQAVPNRPQKATVKPAASSSDTLIESAVTVCPIHIDQACTTQKARRA